MDIEELKPQLREALVYGGSYNHPSVEDREAQADFDRLMRLMEDEDA